MEKINIVKSILDKEFKMQDLGDAQHFLRMNIIRDYEKQTIQVHQFNYIDTILKRFGMDQSKPISTPMENKFSSN